MNNEIINNYSGSNLQRFLALIDNKKVLELIDYLISQQVENGFDSFESSRICYQWANNVNQKSFEFRASLEEYIRGGK